MDKPGSPGGLAKKKNTQQQNKNSGEVCFKLLVSAFSINDWISWIQFEKLAPEETELWQKSFC